MQKGESIRRELNVECPMCGFTLGGNRFAGYRCVRCKTHFSARFVAHVQRARFKSMIDKHFGQPRADSPPSPAVSEATERIIIEDRDHRIARALEEAQTAVKRATQHLEAVADARREQTAPTAADLATEPVAPPDSSNADGIIAGTQPVVCIPVPNDEPPVVAQPSPAHAAGVAAPPPGRIVRKLPNPQRAKTAAKQGAMKGAVRKRRLIAKTGVGVKKVSRHTAPGRAQSKPSRRNATPAPRAASRKPRKAAVRQKRRRR